MSEVTECWTCVDEIEGDGAVCLACAQGMAELIAGLQEEIAELKRQLAEVEADAPA